MAKKKEARRKKDAAYKKDAEYKKDAAYNIPVPGCKYMITGPGIQGEHKIRRVCHDDNTLCFTVEGESIWKHYEISKHKFTLLKG